MDSMLATGRVLAGDAPLSARLREVSEELVRVSGASRVAFLVLSGERSLLVHLGLSASFPEDAPFQVSVLPGSLEARVLQADHALIVPEEPGTPVAERLLAWLGTSFGMFCPITRNSRAMGMLCLGFEERPVSDLAAPVLAVAQQVGLALGTDSRVRGEMQLHGILESIAEAVYVLDPQGQTLVTNRAYLELMGFKRATDPLGTIWEITERIQVRTLDGEVPPIDRLPSVRALHGEVVRDEDFRVISLDGREKVVRVSANPVLDDRGHVICSCVTFKDISELVGIRRDQDRVIAERTEALARTNRQLVEALEDLRQLDRLKADFLNTVSHELRTPLSFIMGFTEFLEDELAGPLTPLQREYVGSVMAGAHQLVRLIDDLLDYARMESGNFRVELRPVELGDLITATLAHFRQLAECAGVTLRCALPQEALRVRTDPDRVVQILNNLAGNALKFTPGGGKVTVRCYTSRDRVIIEVEDTGIGIPEESLSKVFHKFYQVDSTSTRTRGGTGLGLAITRSLVETLGGRILVESELGQGSTFRLELPA